MRALLIGEVAERAGFPAPTIRYYESIGLLEQPERGPSGYRRYSERTITELAFIKKAQALGFSLEEVSEILSMSRSGKAPCAKVLSIARRHLAALDDRLRQLQSFRDQFASQLASWERQRQPSTDDDGLCLFIGGSDPVVSGPTIDPTRPRRKPRKTR